MTGRVLVVWCPDVRDEGAFEKVVAAAGDFCPLVEVLRLGACAIGTRGPARYFGGEEPLGRGIIAVVGALGLGCQAGVADGLFAADLAARTAAPGELQIVPQGGARSFLGPLPVNALGDPDLAGVLPRLGIRTLADFAGLPAAEAVNRFGTAGAVAHRLARGLPPRPLVPQPPAADLSAAIEFDPPVPGIEPVVFAAKSLAEQVQARLSARGLACVRIRVDVTGEHGQQSSRLWRHDGLLSALAVAERVRWQLAGWQPSQQAGQADGEGLPTAGITTLRLVPDELVRAKGRQLGLWGDEVIGDRLTRAAMQVQAMLGHGAVTRPVLSGGRNPGEQMTLVPFGDFAEPARPAGQPWPGQIPPPAPATVFPDPLPTAVTDAQGGEVSVSGRALVSAPPAWLSAAGVPTLAITAWAGPWPVTERWWDTDSSTRKARFHLVTEDNRAWLAAVTGGRWQLEARYD